jgi:hypothetical protein
VSFHHEGQLAGSRVEQRGIVAHRQGGWLTLQVEIVVGQEGEGTIIGEAGSTEETTIPNNELEVMCKVYEGKGADGGDQLEDDFYPVGIYRPSDVEKSGKDGAGEDADGGVVEGAVGTGVVELYCALGGAAVAVDGVTVVTILSDYSAVSADESAGARCEGVSDSAVTVEAVELEAQGGVAAEADGGAAETGGAAAAGSCAPPGSHRQGADADALAAVSTEGGVGVAQRAEGIVEADGTVGDPQVTFEAAAVLEVVPAVAAGAEGVREAELAAGYEDRAEGTLISRDSEVGGALDADDTVGAVEATGDVVAAEIAKAAGCVQEIVGGEAAEAD